MPHGKDPLRAADVRQRNEKIVLRLIHTEGGRGLSQSEAVVATGLKAPTIFRIFSNLEAAGFIETLPPPSPGPAPATAAARADGKLERKGRRPSVYITRRSAHSIVGVEFWAARVSIGIFDFQGGELYSKVLPLARGMDAEGVCALIGNLVDAAIAEVGLDRGKVLGLGLGAPGQVNVRTRTISFYSRTPGFIDFPIAARLEERLGLPVTIHNNCSVIALSEFRYGGLAAGGPMFMFLLRSGVNGAFVDSGRIHLTSEGTTIETGHIPVDVEGPECSCGARGCLEACLAALDMQNLDEGGSLFEGLGPALVSGGEPEAEAVLTRAATHLAQAVRIACRLFSPRSFLFVAASAAVAEALAGRVRDLVAREVSGFGRVLPEFHARSYDPVLAQRGAAALVLDSFLG
jgi:predicted NBD/HSP70 family sugar kinase